MEKGPCGAGKNRPRFQSQTSIPALLLTLQCFHGTHLPTPSLFPRQQNGDSNSNLTKGGGGGGDRCESSWGNTSGATTLTGLHIHQPGMEGQCACHMAAHSPVNTQPCPQTGDLDLKDPKGMNPLASGAARSRVAGRNPQHPGPWGNWQGGENSCE